MWCRIFRIVLGLLGPTKHGSSYTIADLRCWKAVCEARIQSGCWAHSCEAVGAGVMKSTIDQEREALGCLAGCNIEI